jgi:protein-tyrosine phosphatase
LFSLVDMHVHLLAGLDDGPRSLDDAVTMCRRSHAEGVRLSVALAHQNESWPGVTPDVIRAAAARLAERLRAEQLEFSVFPTAEVMVGPDTEADWRAGKLMSVADRGKYLLVEFPHNLYLDVRVLVRTLVQAGVRPILAHPERTPELLHDAGRVEELIGQGALVQISTGSVTKPADARAERALKSWLRRGVVHLIGSDGHSPTRRPPKLADAAAKIRRWAGDRVADRVCGTLGTAILQGLSLPITPPEAPRRSWFARLVG